MRSMSIVIAGLVLMALMVEVIAANSEASTSSHVTAINAGHGPGAAPQPLRQKMPIQ